jgi:hypothetical protein
LSHEGDPRDVGGEGLDPVESAKLALDEVGEALEDLIDTVGLWAGAEICAWRVRLDPDVVV